jgi:hypothetical protein
MVKRLKLEVIGLELLQYIPKELQEECRRQVWQSMIVEGGTCRRLGLPLDYVSCKLLRDPDMQASWRMGWRAEDERIKKAHKAGIISKGKK